MPTYGETLARAIALRISAPTATATTLATIPAADRLDGMMILVQADTDGPPRLYWWNNASTAAAAPKAVILAGDAPSAGRWEAASLAAGSPVRTVRGVVAANVASLAAFAVSGNAYDDGLTYVAGDRVLLTAQTTAAQNGIYVVGTVATTAPLTRATDMAAGLILPNGSVVEVSEGTAHRGSTWKAMATTTGGAVIGTNDPTFYPRSYRQVITLSSGTYTIGAGGGSEQLFLFSTTTSMVTVTRNTAGGTLTNTTGYYAPVASRVAGKAGTAAVLVNASVAAGTINTADNSTIDVLVTNW